MAVISNSHSPAPHLPKDRKHLVSTESWLRQRVGARVGTEREIQNGQPGELRGAQALQAERPGLPSGGATHQLYDIGCII